jgi:glycosyltransferase involved in cell wall biosynthesis
MNILMIAYFYPPKGGGGVQRTLKFVKHLSNMGHRVHVLTVKEEAGETQDKSLEVINKNVTVYRTSIKEINTLKRLAKAGVKPGGAPQKSGNYLKLKRFMRNIAKKIVLDVYNFKYVPDDKCGWINYAVDEGKNIIKNNQIDVLYTTSSPYSSHLIGYELAKETNIKWIADFRDPWAANQFVDFNYFVKRKHEMLEAKVVKRANKVLSVSEPIIKDFITRYKNEEKSKFIVIPNGYDEEDFTSLDLKQSDSNERFTIVYNGMIYGKRSPEKILKAIDNLIKKNKIDKDKIEIKFQGQIGNEHIGTINSYTAIYPKVVKHTGQVGHKESLNELSRANALLLIIDEGPGSEGIYTGKIFEYIRSGKIILGIVPEGVAKDLILDTHTGYTAYPSRIDEIENIIHKAYLSFIDNNKEFMPDYDKISNFSRENLTKKLIEVMNL